MKKGRIHVYTGDGKGKTSAAFGLALRASGHGKKVLILQFLKSGVKKSGEITAAKKCGIRIVKFRDQTSPIFDSTVNVADLKKAIKQATALSLEIIRSHKYDLIIMEEFNNALSSGYATVADVKRILKEKPEGLELVFTGRNAPKELIEAADYVTEMRMVKHPANSGVKARRGIEF